MAANDLVSLAAVKAWCGATSGTDDALLAALISQISRAIYNYINRSFILPMTVTESYDGNGRDQLLLRNWPVGSVSSVLINGQPVPQAPTIISGQALQPGWRLEASDDQPPGAMQQLFLTSGSGYGGGGYGGLYRFIKGRQNIVVTYRAGYEIVGESWTVPATPFQITPLAPYGNWAVDTGVSYANGTALTAVSGAPAQGQYSVNASTGAYTFAAADANAAVLISYGYIPADLEQCALEWVADRYKYKDRIGMTSKSLGGQETVSFQNRSVPDFVKDSLRNFIRILAN